MDARCVEPRDDVGGRLLGTERDQRRGDRRRDDLDPRREKRAAAGRSLRGAVVRPLGPRARARRACPGGRPTTTSRTRTGGRPGARRRSRPARTGSARSSSAMGGRGSRGRGRRAHRWRPGPQSHFCPEIVRKSRPAAPTGIAPTDWAPSTSTGTPLRSRSSREREHRTRRPEHLRRRDQPRPGRDRRQDPLGVRLHDDDGGDRRGERAEQAEVLVRRRHDLVAGLEPEPRSTIAQPSLVEAVSAT